MGLLDFVKSAHSFKVRVGKRTLAEGEVPILAKTADMVVVPSSQIMRLMTHTITVKLKEHTGKKKRMVVCNTPAALEKLISQSDQPATGFGSTAAIVGEFVSSFVTPTLKHDCQDESIFAHDDNVRTPLAFDRPVNETGGSFVLGNETGGSFVLRNETRTSSFPLAHVSLVDDFYDSQTINSATAHEIYVPNWDASLCNLNDAGFLDRLSLNFALHVCMVSKLRLWYEHEITIREMFENKFTESSVVIQLRDAKIANLKYRLRLQRLFLCGSTKTALAKVISLWIDQGIQQGLKARIKHGKARKGLSTVDALLKRVMASLYLEDSSNVENETPDFRTFQPVLEQVLEDSHARAQKYKRDVSSSLIVFDSVTFDPHDSSMVPIVEEKRSSSSLIATIIPLNFLVVTDDPISDTRRKIILCPDLAVPESSMIEPILLMVLLSTDYVALSRFSSSMSRFSSKASSFRIWSTFVHLREGIHILIGIMDSLPYVRENGVSPLLALIMVRCAHSTCDTSSIQFLLPSSNLALIPSPNTRFVLSTNPYIFSGDL
nr:hypothetical protein [Tanacetum cinerariifolium]